MFQNMRILDTSSPSFQKALLAFACLSVASLLFSVNMNEYHESRVQTQLRAGTQQGQGGLKGLNKHLPGRDLQLSRHSKLWSPKSLSDAVDLQKRFSLEKSSSKQVVSETTEFECKGDSPHERGCRMAGVWYDTRKQVFIVDPVEALAGMPPESYDTTVLNSLHGLFSKPWAPNFVVGFKGITSKSKHPARSNTCTVDFPVHLRSSYKTHSFGHLMRDNYYGLTAVPRQFNESSADYAWVTWPRSDNKNAFKMANIVHKYSSWIGNSPAWTWPELMRTFCENKDEEGKRFVHFGKVLLSSGGNDWTTDERPRACKHTDFGAMRDIAYETAGIQHVPVKEQKQKRVVFIAKVITGERRGFLNVDEAAAALQEAFPDVQVDVQWMQRDHIKPEEQLKSMSETTVLIANIGSAGFRQMFLPDGAQAIVVGPPSDDFTAGDGEVYHVGDAFRELDRCFNDVKHWTVHPYQAALEDVVLDPGRMSKVPEAGLDAMPKNERRDFETKRMWDASVILDIPKLTQMVGECLEASTQGREGS